MADFMGIQESVMLDASKVKVIDGIAGSGKSSGLHDWFASRGIEYFRYTSTNALKRDAEARYDMYGKCDTIAGGLFNTEGCRFYTSEKAPSCGTVVIDEILQADKRALDWAAHNRGGCNIFITTDSKQLLAPGCEGLLQAFNEFCGADDVVYTNVSKTKRAIDSETMAAYEDLYARASNGMDAFKAYRNNIPCIGFGNMPISPDNVYITHTKAIENYMYRNCDVRGAGFALIPKGTIARKPPRNLEKYPCLSQLQAEGRRYGSYTQCAAIATPTRYQGQEVSVGQTCYYIIEPGSMVTNREFYTVVTRCKSIKSLVIVILKLPKEFRLDTFAGMPIAKIRYAETTSVAMNEVGKEKYGPDYNFDCTLETVCGRKVAEEDTLWLARACDPAPDGEWNSDEIVYIDGDPVWLKSIAERLPDTNSKKPTPRGLLEREDDMDYGYMLEVYKALDENGIRRIIYPYPNRTAHREDIYESGHYCVDMFCAYLQILADSRVPVDGVIEYNKEYDRDKRIGFFLCRGSSVLANECIITDELVDVCDAEDIVFLFSAPCKKGVGTAARWLADARKSIECKSKYKAMSWGYLQKQYLSEGSGFFVMDPKHCREILMVAIISAMVSAMIRASQGMERYIVIDAVHVKTEHEARTVMSNIIGLGYDCRLSHIFFDGNEFGDKVEDVIDQSYSIQSAAANRRARKRERYRQNKERPTV